MSAAPLPENELARLTALQEYAILDTPPEQPYDDIVHLAARLCHTPMALVTLVDADRQWFKANLGLADCCETSRDVSFCAHALLTPEQVMVVPDATLDARFDDHPMVIDAPGIRFYAGAPLVTPGGQALGTLCVIDTVPRAFDAAMQAALSALARTVMTQLELRRVSRELATVNAHLRSLSLLDGLTGVANRRALDQRLEEELSRSRRHEAPLALLLLDIDHFKSFNDRFGHLEGDALLREFAALLTQDLRQSDLVARYGGEEFCVLLPETTLEGARLLAERYRARIESARFGDAGHAVTASIGLASWHPGHETASALLQAADSALYEAKRGGRNRVVSA